MRQEVRNGFTVVALVIATTSTTASIAEASSGPVSQRQKIDLIVTLAADFDYPEEVESANVSVEVDSPKPLTGKCNEDQANAAGKSEVSTHAYSGFAAERSIFTPRVTPFLDETEESILFGAAVVSEAISHATESTKLKCRRGHHLRSFGSSQHALLDGVRRSNNRGTK